MRYTLSEWADAMDRAADHLEGALVEAEAETAEEAVKTAREQSSGPFSLARLAQMGHPYARRDPRPPMDPAVINVQSGRFRATWAPVPPAAGGAEIRSAVQNDAPEGEFLDGTPAMIDRPVTERIAERVAPERERRVETATTKLLEGR